MAIIAFIALLIINPIAKKPKFQTKDFFMKTQSFYQPLSLDRDVIILTIRFRMLNNKELPIIIGLKNIRKNSKPREKKVWKNQTLEAIGLYRLHLTLLIKWMLIMPKDKKRKEILSLYMDLDHQIANSSTNAPPKAKDSNGQILATTIRWSNGREKVKTSIKTIGCAVFQQGQLEVYITDNVKLIIMK